MIEMLKPRMACGCLLLTICWSPLLTASGAVIDQVAEVIQGDTRMSPERQQRMVQIASEVLASCPEMPADKRERIGHDLHVYLNDITKGTQHYTDAQFEVVGQTLRWALGNYVRIPAVTDKDRRGMHDVAATLLEGTCRFIETTYRDTPPDVRERLRAAVIAGTADLVSKLGNYFYPHYLYCRDSLPSPEDVLQSLSRASFVADDSTKFAPVASILADESLAQGSRLAHVGFFVDRQSFLIQCELMKTTSEFFDASRAKGYVEPPPELLLSYQTLSVELKQAALKRMQEQQNKMRHEAFVREILAGAGIDSIDRVSILLDEYLKGDKPLDPNLEKEHAILVPRVETALRESKPFILDLSRCKLIGAPLAERVDYESISSHLAGTGQGDLAWDGTILLFRGARLLPWPQDQETMSCDAGKYMCRCRLPEGLALPYDFLVAATNGTRYRITINRMSAEALEIQYSRQR